MIAFADGHVSFCLPQLHVCGEVNACVDQPVQQIDSLSVNEHTSILLFPALLQLNSMAVLSKMLSGSILHAELTKFTFPSTPPANEIAIQILSRTL